MAHRLYIAYTAQLSNYSSSILPTQNPNIPSFPHLNLIFFPSPIKFIQLMAYPPAFQLPAQTVSAPLPNPVAVLGPQFIAPYPVDLRITKKLMTLAEGSFAVTDINGTLMFKVKGSVFSLRDRRVLLDAAGNPIITFMQKVNQLVN